MVVGVHGDQFLSVSNRHAAAAPAIEERLGRYLGYFENKFGERFSASCMRTASLTPRFSVAMARCEAFCGSRRGRRG